MEKAGLRLEDSGREVVARLARDDDAGERFRNAALCLLEERAADSAAPCIGSDAEKAKMLAAQDCAAFNAASSGREEKRGMSLIAIPQFLVDHSLERIGDIDRSEEDVSDFCGRSLPNGVHGHSLAGAGFATGMNR